jgi:hypothetical protein
VSLLALTVGAKALHLTACISPLRSLDQKSGLDTFIDAHIDVRNDSDRYTLTASAHSLIAWANISGSSSSGK